MLTTKVSLFFGAYSCFLVCSSASFLLSLPPFRTPRFSAYLELETIHKIHTYVYMYYFSFSFFSCQQHGFSRTSSTKSRSTQGLTCWILFLSRFELVFFFSLLSLSSTAITLGCKRFQFIKLDTLEILPFRKKKRLKKGICLMCYERI